jgi:hypothetical protein
MYEIHVRGRLSAAARASFGELASSERPAETVFYGPIRDDAELHAIMNRVQALGLELLDVHRAPDPPEAPDANIT